MAVRSHCSSLKRNGHKQLAPRHPSHLQSATDHNETATLNHLLLSQLPVENKGQRKNGLSKIRFWTMDSPQDAFSAPLARSEYRTYSLLKLNVRFVSGRDSRARNGRVNFMGAWDFLVLSARTTSMPIKVLVLRGEILVEMPSVLCAVKLQNP